MILLGFYLGHDASICISINGKIKYRKSERINQIKHHRANLNFIFETLKDWGIKNIDHCAYTDLSNGLYTCNEYELFHEGLIKEFPSTCIDHHYAHALSCWPIIDTEKVNYAVVVDGLGNRERSGIILNNLYDPEIIDITKTRSLGYEFYLLGNMLGMKGLEVDLAGKVMGLLSYDEDQMTQFNIKKLSEYDYKKHLIYSKDGNYSNYKEWHEYWWNYLLRKFDPIPKNSNIVYAGGVAQNSVFNYRLKKLYPNIFIPPHCYDGGLSLGCLEFLRIKFNEPKFDKSGFPFWQDDKIDSEPDLQTIKKTARLLAKNKVIGWIQGQGELGPRALGNRSILMNANDPNGKNILNTWIKKREPWRPYAGTTIEEKSKLYFDLEKSEYMLYACNVINENLKTITHIDNTCRMQTVSSGFFYELIKEYGNLTGNYVLCNTSLNIMNKPIVSNANNPLEILKECNLNNLVVGNKIYNGIKFQ